MWVKVLPADDTKGVYFTEIPDEWNSLEKLVHGHTELIKTRTLADKYGRHPDGWPLVAMIVNRRGQVLKLPVNKRASAYYPNEYDILIRGDVVLVGQEEKIDPETGPYYDIASLPVKWKIIYDMEAAVAEGGSDYEKVHSQLDDLLLEAADPDVRKMYEEGRDQFKNWPIA